MKKIILIIFICSLFLIGCEMKEGALKEQIKLVKTDRLSEQKDWVVYNNINDNNSVKQVKDEILKSAKRPSSVEFIQWSKVSPLSGLGIIDDKYFIEYIIYVDFSAMNGFGGYGRSTYVFCLDVRGKIITYSESDDYDWELRNYIDWNKPLN